MERGRNSEICRPSHYRGSLRRDPPTKLHLRTDAFAALNAHKNRHITAKKAPTRLSKSGFPEVSLFKLAVDRYRGKLYKWSTMLDDVHVQFRVGHALDPSMDWIGLELI